MVENHGFVVSKVFGEMLADCRSKSGGSVVAGWHRIGKVFLKCAPICYFRHLRFPPLCEFGSKEGNRQKTVLLMEDNPDDEALALRAF
jgi:hypothetical protein